MDITSNERVDGLKEERSVVMLYLSVLVLLVVFYVLLHFCPKVPAYNQKTADSFFETIGKTKAALLKQEVKPDELIDSLKVPWDGNPSPNNVAVGSGGGAGQQRGDIFMSEFSGRISYIIGFISSFKDEKKTLPQNDQRVVELRD